MKTLKIINANKDESVLLYSQSSSFIHKAYFYYSDGRVAEKLEGIIIYNNLFISMAGIKKIEIFYDGSDLTSEEVSSSANSYYSCTYQKTLTTGSFFPVVRVESGNGANISAAISLTVNNKTVSYNIPVSGKFIATVNKSSLISSLNNTFELSDFSGRRFYCSEYSEFKYKDENLEVIDNVVKLDHPQELSITIEIRVFSTNGQIKERPVIKGVGLRKWIE